MVAATEVIARDAPKKRGRRRRDLIECARMRLATMVHRDGQLVDSVRRDIQAQWKFTDDDDRGEVRRPCGCIRFVWTACGSSSGWIAWPTYR